MTQKDLNRMMGQPHAALDAQDGYVEKAAISASRKIPYFSTTEDGSYFTATGGDGSTAPTASGVVPVTTSGKISVGTPTGDYHAANKKYVDESIKNAAPSTTPFLVMYNYYSKDIVDFVINNVGASGGLTSPFIMFAVGDGTESSQPPLEVSNIYFVIAEYIPGGDVYGHIINIHVPEGVYYCTDTSGSFEYTV